MQTTLRNKISISGKGLHSGKPVQMTLIPAAADHGIRFHRVDVNDQNGWIDASYENVSDTNLCTRISNGGGVEVSTVEHLMAAFSGCGVHNCLVEIDGPEIPILDGSSKEFVREILNVGTMNLGAPLRLIRILKPVHYSDGDVSVSLLPSDNFEIDFTIDFTDKAIGHQNKSLNMANGTFVRELSDCRTFCRESDVEHLQSIGLALGGSLDNAVVVNGADILNEDGFRRSDECVRHKMLDALGDLYLAGGPILGKYIANKAGHGPTNMLLRKLFDTPDAFEFVTSTPSIVSTLPGAGITQSDAIGL